MTLQSVKDILQVLSYGAVLFGIPWGLYQHYRAVKREQRDRELGTYNALDEKYIEYQQLCLAHPELDVSDVPHPSPPSLSPAQERKEVILFTILMSIFERAYLMYSDQSTSVKQRQWSGWDDYIQGFCRRQNFRRSWEVSGTTFDSSFQAYMAASIERSGKGL
jgi:hypothetical protein